MILHEQNQGKGAAVRTGLQAARGDVLLIQDADLEYSPHDYPALLEPIEDGLTVATPLGQSCGELGVLGRCLAGRPTRLAVGSHRHAGKQVAVPRLSGGRSGSPHPLPPFQRERGVL